VGATAGVFNPQKLQWLNQEWIKRTPAPEIARHVREIFGRRGLPAPGPALEPLIELMRERAKSLNEIADAYVAFLADELPRWDDAAVKKQLTADTKPLLVEARGIVETRFGEGAHALEQAFRAFAESRGLGLGKVAQPIRVAVTGTTVSPPLFETIVLLGRDRALKRIDAALGKIA
jgi:glutamyl-tRNA synthetase